MHDAHCHLQDSRFDDFRHHVIKDMHAAGITRCVVNGTCPDDWTRVAELAKNHPELVIPSFGLHPWKKPTDGWEETLIHFLDTTPLACVGECGLDRWMPNYDLKLQTKVFQIQLAIAAERNLPLSIHCLRAWGQLVDILKQSHRPERGFLLHSYGGSAELIPRLARLGAYFSFSGYFLHSRKAKIRKAFEQVPVDRILLESDAPDMLPPKKHITHPLPSDLNHPANLIALHTETSKLLDLSKMVQNFDRFFLR